MKALAIVALSSLIAAAICAPFGLPSTSTWNGADYVGATFVWIFVALAIVVLVWEIAS